MLLKVKGMNKKVKVALVDLAGTEERHCVFEGYNLSLSRKQTKSGVLKRCHLESL